MTSITITTTISQELYNKAHRKIAWSEALRRGVISILQEKGDEDYINPQQQAKKIAQLSRMIEELSQENNRIKEDAKFNKEFKERV